MSEKTKAAISLFLSAAAYLVMGIDKVTAVDLSQPFAIAVTIVGAVAAAFGVYWTAPKSK